MSFILNSNKYLLFLLLSLLYIPGYALAFENQSNSCSEEKDNIEKYFVHIHIAGMPFGHVMLSYGSYELSCEEPFGLSLYGFGIDAYDAYGSMGGWPAAGAKNDVPLNLSDELKMKKKL